MAFGYWSYVIHSNSCAQLAAFVFVCVCVLTFRMFSHKHSSVALVQYLITYRKKKNTDTDKTHTNCSCLQTYIIRSENKYINIACVVRECSVIRARHHTDTSMDCVSCQSSHGVCMSRSSIHVCTRTISTRNSPEIFETRRPHLQTLSRHTANTYRCVCLAPNVLTRVDAVSWVLIQALRTLRPRLRAITAM